MRAQEAIWIIYNENNIPIHTSHDVDVVDGYCADNDGCTALLKEHPTAEESKAPLLQTYHMKHYR